MFTAMLYTDGGAMAAVAGGPPLQPGRIPAGQEAGRLHHSGGGAGERQRQPPPVHLPAAVCTVTWQVGRLD